MQQLVPSFAAVLSQFWQECTDSQDFGQDKDFDLDMFKKIEQAKAASYILAVDYLLKGRDNEAVYMMFYGGGLMKEIDEHGLEYVSNMHKKKSKAILSVGDMM